MSDEGPDATAGGTYIAGTVTPRAVSGSTSGTHADLALEEEDLDAGRTLEVFVTPDGIHVGTDAQGDETRLGVLVTVDTEAARETAHSLLQAAEEYDVRDTSGRDA